MAVRAAQSNAMKIALVTFIVLFIISTTLAVVFYIQAEEFQGAEEAAKADLAKFANLTEQRDISKIVGRTEAGKSYLGTMNTLLNQLVSTITGSEPQEAMPATVKVNSIAMRITELQEMLGQDVNPAYGPNGIALLQTIQQLKGTLDATRGEMAALQEQFQQLQNDFNQAAQQCLAQEDTLRQEALLYQQNALEVQKQYDQLKQLMESSTEEQIQTFKDRLEQEQAKLRQKQLDLIELQEQLAKTEANLKTAMSKIEDIQPRPDITPMAYKPDARIIRVDLQNGIIYLDVGMEDHVYRGLTFAVYDKSAPIPEDGKGKAEIEVFQVSQNVSAARVLRSSIKNPIVEEDIIANLVWDPETSNHFVVAGDFDLNGDGLTDPDGAERIKEMIVRWGGTLDDEMTVNTDFVIIGQAPRQLLLPTQNELALNPTAQQRYEDSLEKIAAYDSITQKANLLSVPIFNQKQFYFLLGYETLASKN